MRAADRAARRAQRQAWRDGRHAWRAQWRSGPWSWSVGAWIPGIVLIIIGCVFLLQTTGALNMHNWWALFLLFPAAAAFATAWGIYHFYGSFAWPARQSLIVGLVLTGICFAFLLGLEETLLLPIVLIGIGVSILVVALVPR
jgi:hypothetical protein